MFTLWGDFKLFSLTGPQREGSRGHWLPSNRCEPPYLDSYRSSGAVLPRGRIKKHDGCHIDFLIKNWTGRIGVFLLREDRCREPWEEMASSFVLIEWAGVKCYEWLHSSWAWIGREPLSVSILNTWKAHYWWWCLDIHWFTMSRAWCTCKQISPYCLHSQSAILLSRCWDFI